MSCLVDGARTRNGWTLCRSCADTLHRQLADVPQLNDALHTAVARQTAHGDRGLRRGTGNSPLPYDTRASGALRRLHSVLARWAAAIDPAYSPQHTVPVLGRHLLGLHHQLVVDTRAARIRADLETATSGGWAAADRPDRPPIPLDVACPDCGRELYGELHDEDDPRPDRIWCWGPNGAESHIWEAKQWLLLRIRLQTRRPA